MTLRMGRIAAVLLMGLFFVMAATAQESPGEGAPEDGADPAAGGTAAIEGPPGAWDFSIFPGFFVTPETGFGGGGGLIINRLQSENSPEMRQSAIAFATFYTEKRQSIVSMAPDLYFNGDNWNLSAEVSYMNFPNTLFGIGNDTPEDSEEDYTLESSSLGVRVLRRTLRSLYLGASYAVERGHILKKESGRLLDNENLPGFNGGLRSGAGLIVSWDSRNNTFYPTKGSWYLFGGEVYGGGLGSDFTYETIQVNLRRYITLRPAHILAGQVLITTAHGEVPFYRLPHLGEHLRGYYAGRYQDNAMAVAQVEYRFPVVSRFSGAVFAGAGDVSDGLEAYRLRDLKYAAGLGARYAMNEAEKINLRLDFGYGRHGGEMYIAFLEAF